jgi:hypothetical protein
MTSQPELLNTIMAYMAAHGAPTDLQAAFVAMVANGTIELVPDDDQPGGLVINTHDRPDAERLMNQLNWRHH